MGERSSGDFALCFATGNRGLEADEAELPLRMLNDTRIDALYEATIDGVEESILNAHAGGGDDDRPPAATPSTRLPHDLLLEALGQAGSSITSST